LQGLHDHRQLGPRRLTRHPPAAGRIGPGVLNGGAPISGGAIVGNDAPIRSR